MSSMCSACLASGQSAQRMRSQEGVSAGMAARTLITAPSPRLALAPPACLPCACTSLMGSPQLKDEAAAGSIPQLHRGRMACRILGDVRHVAYAPHPVLERPHFHVAAAPGDGRAAVLGGVGDDVMPTVEARVAEGGDLVHHASDVAVVLGEDVGEIPSEPALVAGAWQALHVRS